MTDRIPPGSGGMTGATGDLTPDQSDEAFVPGERREIAGAIGQGQVTDHQASAAPAQGGELGDPGGELVGGPTNMAERESGYGSEHGLSPDDPAYRMERHVPAADVDPGASAPSRETRAGGDLVENHEERF